MHLVEGPLAAAADGGRGAGRSGAVVLFEGVVRGSEGGRPLRCLRYEAYEPMTTAELQRLGGAVVGEFGLQALGVWHSVGEVGVGEVSFRLRVRSAHRAEALAAASAFIDRMKADVPLWKVPAFG